MKMLREVDEICILNRNHTNLKWFILVQSSNANTEKSGSAQVLHISHFYLKFSCHVFLDVGTSLILLAYPYVGLSHDFHDFLCFMQSYGEILVATMPSLQAFFYYFKTTRHSTMTEIRYVMWNCSGTLPTKSTDEKIDFLEMTTKNNFDILILIETHHKDENCLPTRLLRYKNTYHMIHTEASDDDPYAGIIVFVRKNWNIFQKTELIRGRLLNIIIQHSTTGKKYNITPLYFYTANAASKAKIQDFTEKLSKSHRKGDQNVILGDFNFVENDFDRTSDSRVGMNQSDRTLSIPWTEFINTLDVSDPFRKGNHKRKMFSYIHTQRKAKSRIDRIYVNDESTNNIIHYKHTITPFTQTHKIISFTLTEENSRGPVYWKMNSSIINDLPYQGAVEKTYQDVLDLNIDDPVERWLIFIQTIRIETQVYCSKKRYIENRIKKICERNIEMLEQNQLLNENPLLQEEYEYNLRKLNDWQIKQIKGYQARIKSQPKLEPGEPNIAFFANLERKNAKKSSIGFLQNDKGEVKYQTHEIKDIVTDFYTKLYTPRTTDDKVQEKLIGNIKNKITPTQRQTLDKPITMEELEKNSNDSEKRKITRP